MWPLKPGINLATAGRVSTQDADRQLRTADAILRSLADQPGVVLADEVGMGKTYVALAVAVSVLEATGRANPVVVLVPAAVAEKWPREWQVFAEHCLPPGHGLRGSRPVKRGSDLLKLLDDPPEERQHLIFATHTALTSRLTDPLIRLALLRQATRYNRDGDKHRRVLAKHAHALLREPRFRGAAGQALVATLLEKHPGRWKQVWDRGRPEDALDDDPVPAALLGAVAGLNFEDLRQALAAIPVYRTANLEERLKVARAQLEWALGEVWKRALQRLDVRLPLLILDEAHHVKNRTQLGNLFANTVDERGALGNMFERMLFLTATPFQLNHDELIRILRRFRGVRWSSQAARERFDDQVEEIQNGLNRSRAAALRLERAWSRLEESDAPQVASVATFDVEEGQSERVRTAITAAAAAHDELRSAEKLLRPWVIRHTRVSRTQRRDYHPGRAILDGRDTGSGLAVEGEAVLPFLLAARAEAIANLHWAGEASPVRGYYAYGLASSFEAYADTRAHRIARLDDLETPDDCTPDTSATAAKDQLRWYVERIKAALPHDTVDGWASHPKVAATVSRVVDLWRRGEKVLVFCFYRETGRALRNHISRAIRREIIDRAAQALGRPADDDVLAEVDAVAERLLRSDVSGYDAFRERVASYLDGLDGETAQRVQDVAVRFMRTPSFLTRYVDLSPNLTIEGLLTGLDSGAPGATFADQISAFAAALAQQVGKERDDVLNALASIQTGGIRVSSEHFDTAEHSHDREVFLPNVRLVNGEAKPATRETLIQTFNTPFFPEVLVASSVMAEGVDLHHACRHVIHHDLDWNPSTLEQRTGRVDRIGSQAARVGQPVVVYEPYVGGTHDEKMFRVVKDRERWFGIVMGESPDSSEWATERQAARIPLPPPLATALTLDLSVPATQ